MSGPKDACSCVRDTVVERGRRHELVQYKYITVGNGPHTPDGDLSVPIAKAKGTQNEQ